MASRLKLHSILCGIIGSDKCYFEPPETVKLVYPCIVYERNVGDTKYANNMPYRYIQGYSLTLIDKNPDSEFVTKLAMSLPTIRFNRHFTANNLNHDVFNLFY